MPTTTSIRTLPLPILPLPTNPQLRELGYKDLRVNGKTYRFEPYLNGKPGWRSGGEGKAYRLLNVDGTIGAYLKFFNKSSPERLGRTRWLIKQQIPTWLPNLAAGPTLWFDTRTSGRPEGVSFDFAGAFAEAVPGETWRDLKSRVANESFKLTEDFRWRCAMELIHSMAILEGKGMIHGDLSPANIVIDVDALAGRPALYPIDFDAFVAQAAGRDLSCVSGDGCTYGTDGYFPPGLVERARGRNARVVPETDLYGRDMLLLELLFVCPDFPKDKSPREWDLRDLKPRVDRLRNVRPELAKLLAACSSRLSSDQPKDHIQQLSSSLLAELRPFVNPILALKKRRVFDLASELAEILGLETKAILDQLSSLETDQVDGLKQRFAKGGPPADATPLAAPLRVFELANELAKTLGLETKVILDHCWLLDSSTYHCVAPGVGNQGDLGPLPASRVRCQKPIEQSGDDQVDGLKQRIAKGGPPAAATPLAAPLPKVRPLPYAAMCQLRGAEAMLASAKREAESLAAQDAAWRGKDGKGGLPGGARGVRWTEEKYQFTFECRRCGLKWYVINTRDQDAWAECPMGCSKLDFGIFVWRLWGTLFRKTPIQGFGEMINKELVVPRYAIPRR